MKRVEQVALIISFVLFSWLALQVVHELGHVLGARITGGTVSKVVLHPLAISRTDLSHNPHPLFVVWMGPIAGVLLPLIAVGIARLCRTPGMYLFRFFAGACLIANGVYIGAGSFVGAGDAGDMLRHGSSRWQLILFGMLTLAIGLWLWHGIGPKFGLGKARGQVNRPAVIVSVCLCTVIVVAELLLL